VVEHLDCLVIGGGPAGLTAGIYFGRFLRSAVIVDGGWSRAEWITDSRNQSGYTEAVNGHALLERMRGQAISFGSVLKSAYIDELLMRDDGIFIAKTARAEYASRTVLLATGVVENKPPVPHFADAVKRGLIRTCAICQGYESRGEAIAVLGDGEHAAHEVLFIRTYTNKLSLLLTSPVESLSAKTRSALDAVGIKAVHVGAGTVHIEAHGVTSVSGEDGRTHRFDAIFTAFGTVAQTALADCLGARADGNGRLTVNEHQETSVPGLYAAGDVVRGLNQISVAYGEAAIAATAIHNSLAKLPYTALDATTKPHKKMGMQDENLQTHAEMFNRTAPCDLSRSG
jgi:thioredoxin reductase (NADPH)